MCHVPLYLGLKRNKEVFVVVFSSSLTTQKIVIEHLIPRRSITSNTHKEYGLGVVKWKGTR